MLLEQTTTTKKITKATGKRTKRNRIIGVFLTAAILLAVMITNDGAFTISGLLNLIGLSADTGERIAYAQGGNRASDEQLLARAIHGEARGEPYEGQVAVGAVIINRTRDPKFPKTIAGVIYQPGAFTAVSDGQINIPLKPGSTALKAARDALNGWDPTDGCLYYWNPATATSKWIWSRQIVKKIGKHYFGK